MSLATIRRRFSLAIMSVLFLTMLLPLNALADTAFAQTKPVKCPQGTLCSFRVASHTAITKVSASTNLTIERVWTRDGNGNDQSSFNPGAAIQYTLIVNNSSSSTITATFHFEDYWGKVNDGVIQIFDHIFSHVSVPTGRTGYYTPTTVPTNALPGSYTDRVYVHDENNIANQDTGYGSFAVKGKVLLGGVPFYSQYKAPTAEQNQDCGPASVAMVLAYYKKGPGGTPGQQIAAIRKVIGDHDRNYTRDTIGKELEYALTHKDDGSSTGVSYSEISQYIQYLPNPDTQETDMAVAIKQGHPVIAFINAQDKGKDSFGRSYPGHWLVVVGFSNDGINTYVLLNDPDDQAPRKGYPNWIKGGSQIPVVLSTFGNAVIWGRGLEPNNIAGIIATV